MLSTTNNPLYAAQCLLKGLVWLTQASLRKFLVIPLIINLILYSILFVLSYFYLNDVITRLIPAWLHWLAWLIKPLFFIAFLTIGFFTFTLLANLIASPFYGKLAEKTHRLILESKQVNNQTETEQSADDEEVTAADWWQEIKSEFQRLGYLLKWMIVLVIISLIPVVNLTAPLLWAIFGAWGCALEFFAYPLENKKLLFPAQKKVVAGVRFGALSFGGLVLVGLSVPLFNLFVSPAAVIAATFYVHGIDEAAN